MVSVTVLSVCFFVFVMLGVMWIVGYNVVKKHSPKHLPQFYFLMAGVRFFVVVAMVAVYLLFVSDDMAQSKSFVLTVFLMYVAMMVITLKLKH